MPGVLLFCIAEEAKDFARKVLSLDKNNFPFYLVESREGPTHLVQGQGFQPSGGFKDELKDGETFETGFIGASVEDCGSWALVQQATNNMVEQDAIAILDERSSKDETIIVAIYLSDANRELLRKDQKTDTWYEFRVPFQKSMDICLLTGEFGNPYEEYGVYFWRKEELTDEYNIFNVDRAKELYLRGEGRIFVEEGAEEGAQE